MGIEQGNPVFVVAFFIIFIAIIVCTICITSEERRYTRQKEKEEQDKLLKQIDDTLIKIESKHEE